MFKLNFSYRLEKLQKAKDLYPKARQKFRDRIASIAIPKIRQDIETYFSPYPGPSVNGVNSGTPWEFATSLSRQWFMANFPKGYTRKEELAQGWKVELTTTFESSNASFLAILARNIPLKGDISVVIFNDDPASIYVYGPRQVPGHRRTGWGVIVQQNRALVQRNALDYIAAEWGPSVKAAMVEV